MTVIYEIACANLIFFMSCQLCTVLMYIKYNMPSLQFTVHRNFFNIHRQGLAHAIYVCTGLVSEITDCGS